MMYFNPKTNGVDPFQSFEEQESITKEDLDIEWKANEGKVLVVNDDNTHSWMTLEEFEKMEGGV